MSASLRERVIEQIEPSVAATVSREVLRRQIEEIIHAIANQDRLELSGREQLQLADELANDMTGYGPLRPLLLDDSINDVMVNGPSNVYVERAGQAGAGRGPLPRQRSHRSRWRRRLQRGSDGASTNPVRWWIAACRTAAGSTSSSRRWRSIAPASPSASFPAIVYDIAGMIANGTMTPAIGRLAGDRRPVPAQHSGLRRHRLRQDHAAERHEPIHRSQRTHRHHRGCGGIAACSSRT